MSPTSDDRPVFFVHIMRTGGTSLRQQLWRRADEAERFPAQRDLDLNQGHYLEYRDVLAMPSAFFAATRLVIGHYPVALADHLPVRPRILTLLRDPVARSLSHLRWLRGRNHLVRGRSLLELLDDEVLVERQLRDYQLRYFGLRDRSEAWTMNQPLAPAPERLDVALAALEDLDVVGVTERYADTVRLVEDRLDLDLGPEVHVNAASDEDAEVTDEVVERLRAVTTNDRLLHRAALERLERDLAAAPASTR